MAQAQAESDTDAFALFGDLAISADDAAVKPSPPRSPQESRSHRASAHDAPSFGSAVLAPSSAQPKQRAAASAPPAVRPRKPPLAVAKAPAAVEHAPPSYDDIMGDLGSPGGASDDSSSVEGAQIRSVFIHVGSPSSPRPAEPNKRVSARDVQSSVRPSPAAAQAPARPRPAAAPAPAASSPSPDLETAKRSARSTAHRSQREDASSNRAREPIESKPDLLGGSTAARTQGGAQHSATAHAEPPGSPFFRIDDDAQTAADAPTPVESVSASAAADFGADFVDVGGGGGVSDGIDVRAPESVEGPESPEPFDLLGVEDSADESQRPEQDAGLAQVDDLDDFFQAGATESDAAAPHHHAAEQDDFFGAAPAGVRGAPATTRSVPHASAAAGGDLIGGMAGRAGAEEAGDDQLARMIGETHDACANVSAQRAHKLHEAIAGAQAYVDKRMVCLVRELCELCSLLTVHFEMPSVPH